MPLSHPYHHHHKQITVPITHTATTIYRREFQREKKKGKDVQLTKFSQILVITKQINRQDKLISWSFVQGLSNKGDWRGRDGSWSGGWGSDVNRGASGNEGVRKGREGVEGAGGSNEKVGCWKWDRRGWMGRKFWELDLRRGGDGEKEFFIRKILCLKY